MIPTAYAGCLLILSLATALQGQGQAQPVAGEDRHAKIYDLSDLQGLVAKQPVAEPEIAVGAASDLHPAPPPVGAGPLAVARLVRAFVKPALLPNEEVKALGERWIVVLGRAEQHAWVERFLASARGQAEQLITIRCDLYSMPELVYRTDVEPALMAEPATEAGDRSSTVLAPGPGTEAFLAALREHREVSRMETPLVVVRPLTTAHLTAVNQTAYVRDFHVEVAKDAFIADPIVDVIQDGLSIQAAATILHDDAIGLSVDVNVAELKRPIPTFETTLGGSTLPVTIQLPQVLKTTVEAAVELRRHHTVAFALPSLAGVRYLVTVQVGAPGTPKSEPKRGK